MFTAEPAVFSCRIQLLVSKLGRSSKPMPRFLVVVRYLWFAARTFTKRMILFQSSKAVHIIVTNQTDGRIQMTLERRIPLVSIRSIAMSNLRDDWLVSKDFSVVFLY
jgi:myosin I